MNTEKKLLTSVNMSKEKQTKNKNKKINSEVNLVFELKTFVILVCSTALKALHYFLCFYKSWHRLVKVGAPGRTVIYILCNKLF